MRKRIVFSIPVHEQIDVVFNQLDNIRKFVENCKVVLHVSADSPPKMLLDLKMAAANKYVDFLYLNSTQYHTYAPNEAANVTGLSTVHSSNFRFMSRKNSFDIFSLDTSNDMFVRKGINEVFDKYDCGFNALGYKISDVNLEGYYKDFVDRLRNFVDVKTYERGPQEGSFYPAYVFKKVSDIILDKIGGFVKDEEGHLPMLAFNSSPEIYNNRTGHYVFHNANHKFVFNQDVLDVKAGKYPNYYSVKRVPRNMDHPCRVFVNSVNQKD